MVIPIRLGMRLTGLAVVVVLADISLGLLLNLLKLLTIYQLVPAEVAAPIIHNPWAVMEPIVYLIRILPLEVVVEDMAAAMLQDPAVLVGEAVNTVVQTLDKVLLVRAMLVDSGQYRAIRKMEQVAVVVLGANLRWNIRHLMAKLLPVVIVAGAARVFIVHCWDIM